MLDIWFGKFNADEALAMPILRLILTQKTVPVTRSRNSVEMWHCRDEGKYNQSIHLDHNQNRLRSDAFTRLQTEVSRIDLQVMSCPYKTFREENSRTTG